LPFANCRLPVNGCIVNRSTCTVGVHDETVQRQPTGTINGRQVKLDGYIVNRNIATLGFTMRLFSANLREQSMADRSSWTGY